MEHDFYVIGFTVIICAVLGVFFGGYFHVENRRLRKAIRTHRDARGNDRCWLDDEMLYRALGDEYEAMTMLPSKEVFLTNCERYHANRQHPYHLKLFNEVFPDGASPPKPKE